MRLIAAELTAVFNPPAINRHSKLGLAPAKRTEETTEPAHPLVLSPEPPVSASHALPEANADPVQNVSGHPLTDSGKPEQLAATQETPQTHNEPPLTPNPAVQTVPPPNL